MNEGNSVRTVYRSSVISNAMSDLSFFSINHSRHLAFINHFIKSKLLKYQSKAIYPSAYSLITQPRLDYIDKLKSYYKSKYKQLNTSLARLRLFTIRRKELKTKLQLIKTTYKGLVLSMFLGVNTLFGFKRIEFIKTTPQLFINFFILTSAMAISSNFLIQKRIDKAYKRKMNKLEKSI